MKKVLFTAVSLILFAAFIGYNAYQKSSMDPLLMENIQAVAQGDENDSFGIYYCTYYPMPLICVQSGNQIVDTGYQVFLW